MESFCRLSQRDAVILLFSIGFFSAVPTAWAAAGRMAGDFAVSQTGEAQYSIPIITPPGPNGLRPDLALFYAHRNEDTLFGIGWGIAGLSLIHRCNRTWAQDGIPRNVRNDSNDRFCLDGMQLKLLSGTYGNPGASYRTEIESFSRITSYGTAGNGPAYFIVERKDGLIYEYGNSTDSRIESIGQSTARAWTINKIRDRSGNEILFNYAEDTTNGSYRVSSIQYGGNAGQGLTPAHTVSFLYETKSSNEIDSRYLAGSRIKQITRLDRIDITYNSTVVRRYELTYEFALSSTSKSRLASVQECAGSPLDCLPATTFSYQNGSAGAGAEIISGGSAPSGVTPWPLDVNGDGRRDLVYSSSLTSGAGTWMVMLANASGGYASPINTTIANTNYTQAISIDYNGDGRDDLLVPYSGGTWWVMLGTTSGLAPPANTNTPTTAGGVGINAHAIDIDGDGLQDLVWADLVGLSGGDAIRYRLRVNGGTFSSTVNTLVGPLPADSMIANPVWGFPHMPGSRNPDFTGDTRDDLLYRRRDGVFIDGPNIWQFTNYTVAVSPGAATSSYVGAESSAPVYGDFNGDGHSDLLYITGASTSRLRFSTGTGFTSDLAGPNPAPYQGGWVSYDWDGDGFDDILARNSSTGVWSLIRSTGENFLAAVATSISTSDMFIVTDINGDRLLDLAYASSGTWRFRLHVGSYPDLLHTATDAFGNGVTFTYAPLPSANYSKHSDAAFPEQDYQGPLYVVNEYAASNGIGGTYTTNFWYYGARMHRQGRGFEGFQARRTQDSRNVLYAYEYFNRAFPYTGAPSQSDTYQPNGSTLIARTVNGWATHNYGTGSETRYLPYPDQSTTTRYEVGGSYNGSLISTSVTTNFVDSTTGTLYDSSVTTTEATSANGVNAGMSHTQRTYHSSLYSDFTNWCIGRPQITQAINSHTLYGGSAQTRQTNITWDGGYCRPSQVVLQPGDTQWQVTTEIGYDSFGNLNSRTVTGVGMAGRTTTINWGTTGAFPVSVTNALSQTTAMSWNSWLGVQTSESDPNGVSILWEHDGFGRLTREQRADSTETTWTYNDCAAVSGGCITSNNKMVIIERDLDSSDALIADRWLYTDLLDRPLSGRAPTLSGAYTRVDQEFDALGRLFRRGAPCWASSCAQYWTTYTYDVVNRLSTVSQPVSETDSTLKTATSYHEGLTTRVVDPLGNQKTYVANAIGRKARSIDPNSYYQSFDYDPFGSLLRVTDSAPNTLQSNTYNILGAITGRSDMDLGNWSFMPNALGEIVSQTTAKGQTSTFGYDALGRMNLRIEPEGTTTWTWGATAAAKNIGKLQSVSSPGGYSESYTYDGIGRLATAQTTVDSVNYTYTHAYNANTGLLDSLEYPASTGTAFKVQYEYQYGRLVRLKNFNTPTEIFWEGFATNPRSQLIDDQLGGELRTNRAYDLVTGLVSSIQTGSGGGSAEQNLAFTWDKVGNLKTRSDLNQGSLYEQFFYDSSNRLDYVQRNGTTTQDIGYDALGNISSKSDVGSYTYHATKKHAVTAAGSNSFSYDANGNMITRNGLSTSWYSYNLPQTINGPGGKFATFYYGAHRQRYKQEHQAWADGSSQRTTIYAGSLYEKAVETDAGATQTIYRHYLVVEGRRIATHLRYTEPGYTYSWNAYYTHDHLGSIVKDYPDDETASYSFSYDAFGKRRGANWTVLPSSEQIGYAWTDRSNRGFTDHEHLDNLGGLIHMNGRVYDSVIGRFMSADPFIDGADDTQGYNRYSYVGNNPLSHTDPSGFCRHSANCLPVDGKYSLVDVYVFADRALEMSLYEFRWLYGGGGDDLPHWSPEGAPLGTVTVEEKKPEEKKPVKKVTFLSPVTVAQPPQPACDERFIETGNNIAELSGKVSDVSSALILTGLGVAVLGSATGQAELAVPGLTVAQVGGIAGIGSGGIQIIAGIVQGRGGGGYQNVWNGALTLASGGVISAFLKPARAAGRLSARQRAIARVQEDAATVTGGFYDLVTTFADPISVSCPRN